MLPVGPCPDIIKSNTNQKTSTLENKSRVLRLTSISKSNLSGVPFLLFCECCEFWELSRDSDVISEKTSSLAGLLRDVPLLTEYWKRRVEDDDDEEETATWFWWEKPGVLFGLEMYHGFEGLVSILLLLLFRCCSASCRSRLRFSSVRYCNFFLLLSNSFCRLWKDTKVK